MEAGRVTVLIMAAGTGGHVFPALSIADALSAQGVDVQWLGTPHGLENKLLEGSNIPLHRVSVKGLRGAGLKRLLLAPFMILQAFAQSWKVMSRVKPDCVIGMGGFVCGPAGVASRIRGIPLLIHEQNAVAGLTNRLLSRLASKVCEAFPNTFSASARVVFTGNPIRKEIAAIRKNDSGQEQSPLKILVLGGSQGARSINQVVPEMLSSLGGDMAVETWHQTGSTQLDEARNFYRKKNIDLDSSHRLVPFIDEMAEAYSWADLVVCRSGASTVSEIAAAGLPAIFIPYPYHKDNQQVHNAEWLANAGAAKILLQGDLTEESLGELINDFVQNRASLQQMGEKACDMAILDADIRIAELCKEVAGVK